MEINKIIFCNAWKERLRKQTDYAAIAKNVHLKACSQDERYFTKIKKKQQNERKV